MTDLSNENILHVKDNEVQFLQFKKLLEFSDIITHVYSLGTDIDFRTENNAQSNGTENYKRLCSKLGLNYLNIVKPVQEHTDNIKIVDNKTNKENPDFNLEVYKKTDGLITNKKNIILSTTNADCILFIFFDPIKKIIANVHSGWKGTLNRISVKTVKQKIKRYNCNPKDIICCICPSIRKCHFEVEIDVKNLFFNEFKELENINEIIIKTSENKWNIDTVLINKVILKQIGLQENNIIDSEICSVCNSNLIHSYRIEKENYGLETALIGLK